MSLFLLIAAITFGLSLFSAIRPLILSQSYILASFWSNTILSVTMSGVLLWMSWILEPEKSDEQELNFVSFEEKVGNSRKSTNARRRSSIWFDDIYQATFQRGREESDSTRVEDYRRQLEPIEEGNATVVPGSAKLGGLSSDGGGEKDFPDLSLYRITSSSQH
jgi:hypothetical protein